MIEGVRLAAGPSLAGGAAGECSSLRPPLNKVLALPLELCLPKLVSSPAPGGLDRRTSGFQPESSPQGQSKESTPLTSRASPSVPQNLLARRRAKGRRVVPMAGLMAKIRKWLGLEKKS
jgi:hypothetical protein